MSFQNPNLIWLLAPASALVLASLLRAPRGTRFIGAFYAVLRLAMIALVIISLAGPYRITHQPLQAVTAILDISASITEPQGEELLQKARALAAAHSVPLSVVPFAGGVVPRGVRVSSGNTFRSIRTAWQSLDTGSTNLAQALRGPATRAAPFTLLLSDGYETKGAARKELAQLASQPIFPLSSTGEDSQTTLAISQLSAPRSVPAQRSAEIRTTVSNHGQAPMSADLEVRHGDGVILNRTITIAPGSDLSALAQSNPELEGLHPIQARISWRDQQGAHTVTRTTWLSTEKRDKVLLLSGSSDDDRFLSQILKSQAYQLRSVVVDSGRDTDSLKLGDYESIVLNNVAKDRIPDGIASGLQRYIRSGGGLVVVGGANSFGLGGYIGSSIESLLPVKLLPPQPEKKRLTVAVQLVVDKSRSMATDNRLEFAKAAAAEVVRNLKDDDYIGVIGFDEVPFIALPVSKLAQVRDSAISRISRLFPTSRTNLFPALDEARRGLAATPAGRKHVIVLTDGKLPDPGPYYFELIRQMRFVGVTVSTVMVGMEVDDGFLAQMAQAGGGAFYQTNDPSNLPKVFLSDVKVASGERTLKEDLEIAVRPGPDPIVSTGIDSYPSLRGFVQTAERDEAQTELLARDAEGTHPLLASWNYGSGRVIAFTSDANGRWSANWMRWERIHEFWSDIVAAARGRDVERAPSRIDFDLRTWVEGSDLVIDLALFAEIGRRTIEGVVQKPDGTNAAVEFLADKPGHFRGRLAQPTAGTYKAEIRLGASVSGDTQVAELPEVAWELDGGDFGERPHRAPDFVLLNEIAQQSGGVIDPKLEDLKPFLHQEQDKKNYAHELLILSLVLLLVEFLVRVVGGRYRIGK